MQGFVRAGLCPLCVVVFGGCGSNDVDFSFGDGLGDDPTEAAFHGPYVQGATLDMFARAEAADTNLNHLSVRSSDPDVFEIGWVWTDADSGTLSFGGHAVSEGRADVEVVSRSGGTIASHGVDVRMPDRADLTPAGWVLVGIDEPVTDPSVVVPGLATFELTYFQGDQELFGDRALTVESGGGDAVTVGSGYQGRHKDWLQVASTAEGTLQVELSAGGEAFQDSSVERVGAASVARVALLAEDDSARVSGEWLSVVAQAYAADDTPVFGASYDWLMNGEAYGTSGDVLLYEYLPDDSDGVSATLGDVVATGTVHAGGNLVTTSNPSASCSATGLGASSLLAAAGLAAAFGRRRYRA